MGGREAFRKEIEDRLNEIEIEMRGLQETAENADAERRAGYERRIRELSDRREEIRDKMKALENACESTWECIREDIENIWDKLKHSLSLFVL